MERKPIIAANWKMNNTPKETRAFFEHFTVGKETTETREVIIAPPFPSLEAAAPYCTEQSGIILAAQDIYPKEKGAFTGMVGSELLLELGVKAVITGHSERRHVFHEATELITEKSLFALSKGMKVILCVGETLEERERGQLFDIVEQQLTETADSFDSFNNIIIAYEPVWAIGTGKTATPEQAEEMHAFIRKIVIERYQSEKTPILYGGSVKPANISELMAKPNIDGALVGGASLKPDSFTDIIRYR